MIRLSCCKQVSQGQNHTYLFYLSFSHHFLQPIYSSFDQLQMPSSSTRDTCLEHDLQYLFVQALVKSVVLCYNNHVTYCIVDGFLDVLDRDRQWWETMSKGQQDTQLLTEHGREEREHVWRRLLLIDRQKSADRVLEELLSIFSDVSSLLTSYGRNQETSLWRHMVAEFFFHAEELAHTFEASLSLREDPRETNNDAESNKRTERGG